MIWRRPLMQIETKHVFCLAVLVVLANVLCDSRVLSRLLPATDLDRFDLGGFGRKVHVASAVLVIALLALRRRWCGTLRLGPAVLGGAFLVLLGEAFLRVTLCTRLIELPLVEYPGLYADPFSDDDFWVLETGWSGSRRPRRTSPVDPELGWTASNGGTLGVSGPRFRELSDVTERPVLFFGDSFVADLPERLELQLPGHDVLNYGVGGYGTDQILLRAERQVRVFRGRNPLVLIGVLLEDMDRSLLRFRGGQKPYFTIESGRLVEHAPRFSDDEEFLRNHRLRIRSFLLAAASGLKRLLTRRFGGDPARREAINRLLFQRACRQLAAEGIEAGFVVFFSRHELKEVALGREPERLRELRGILRDVCTMPGLETSDFLFAEEAGREIESLYLEDGHHSALANEIISRSLARAIRHGFCKPIPVPESP
jgi:hypothetical protein